MYTTRPDQDRSGMGFAFMEAFMDSVEVESELGKGTRVRMKRQSEKAGIYGRHNRFDQKVTQWG